MSTLYGAFPFVQAVDISVLVAYNLDFDVLTGFDILLQDTVAEAKESLCFRLRAFELSAKLRRLSDDAHAFAASSSRGFQHHRIPDVGRKFL